MKIPPVKGTRDFYPAEMRIRNFIVDGWKAASLRSGFEEFDGPIFEYLKMYQVKSGDEIVEQLFNITDRAGRHLAIRPEMTPTLARMVNQQANSLARPIKWFSVPRLCRAERPQKGRLREFFQWNIDIIGVEDVLADAEVIFCALDYLKSLSLTADDIEVRISSRKMLAEILLSVGIRPDELDSIYALLDKKSKIPQDAFNEMLAKQITDKEKCSKIIEIMSADSLEQLSSCIESNENSSEAIAELKRLFDLLELMGVGQFCRFDIGIVRGLAYYTGVVFEIYDKGVGLRAIGGGGRYHNLLKQFGGPELTATGFGMGDCVLQILLEEKGLLQKQLTSSGIDFYIAAADQKYIDKAVEITSKLRLFGKTANFSYKPAALKKQLKQASQQAALVCVIVGEEIEKDLLVIKDMTTGQQKQILQAEFMAQF